MRICEEHRLGGCGVADTECVGCVLDGLRSALAWYADYGEGAAKDPKALPSQGVALGMLQHDGGRRAREALRPIRKETP